MVLCSSARWPLGRCWSWLCGFRELKLSGNHPPQDVGTNDSETPEDPYSIPNLWKVRNAAFRPRLSKGHGIDDANPLVRRSCGLTSTTCRLVTSARCAMSARRCRLMPLCRDRVEPEQGELPACMRRSRFTLDASRLAASAGPLEATGHAAVSPRNCKNWELAA